LIDALDRILIDLIQSRVSALKGATQVGFGPPDEDWFKEVVSAGEERLNIYFYDVKENLKLRSNEHTRQSQNGWYGINRVLPKIDCLYLLTAWSPALLTVSVEPSLDEHLILYSVLQVLMRNQSLLPAQVYEPGITFPSGRDLSSVPTLLRNEELPLRAVIPDAGMREMGLFWSSMKGLWRPAIQLTVTLPVFMLDGPVESPMVTTLSTDYRSWDGPSTAEVWLSIGGQVTSGTPVQSLKGTYVQIQGLNPPEVKAINRHVITLADGRFLFSQVPKGSYHLRAVAPGVGDVGRDVELPSTTGEYDLRFP
jgi:hypothetical protein